MTLVEVLLSAAILGIMAIAATRATFYPRVLAVSSTLKQLAVQAGTGEIERLRADYTYDSMPASFTTNLTAKFNLKGRPISATGTVQEFTASKAGYADYQYKRITVTVDYGATNLTLITYRSP
jgi:type II secretory pathway pseudopilin PulG